MEIKNTYPKYENEQERVKELQKTCNQIRVKLVLNGKKSQNPSIEQAS